MSDIFISYARKDNQAPPDGDSFVTRLTEALTSKGFDVWMDKQDIIPAGKFEEDIQKGILESDAFLLVISPYSLAPESFCGREIEYALERNKRLIPLIRSDKDANGESLRIPSHFAELDWIFARKGDDFDSAITRIEKVLRSGDQGYIHTHSRLLTRAESWAARERASGFLLRRGDLKEAESWYRESARSVDGRPIEPRPTPLQIDYLQASQRAARAFQRFVSAISLIGLVIMSVLAVAAVINAGLADRRALEAHSLALAANAQVVAERDSALALALAVEANTIPDPPFVAQSILSRYAYAGGELVKRLKSNPFAPNSLYDAMTAIAYSRDGRYFAIGTNSGAISLWDAQALTPIKELPPHHLPVISLAFSPDGNRLLSGGDNSLAGDREQNNELRLWTLADSSYISLEGHKSPIYSVAFTPDGATAISVEGLGIVRAWDGVTGAPRWQAETVSNALFAASFTSGAISIDGLSVYVTDNFAYDIVVLDVATGTQTRKITLDIPGKEQDAYMGCYKILLNPDGRRLLCAGMPLNDPALYLFDINNGNLLVRYQPIESQIVEIAFSQSGDRLVTSDTNSLRLWETNTGRNIHTYLTNFPGASVGYSPDGEYILANLGGDVGVWDAMLHNSAQDGTIWNSNSTFRVAYDSTRSAVWVADAQRVRLLDETDGGVRAEFEVGNPVSALVVMPDGGALIATFNHDLMRWSKESIHEAGSPNWTATTGNNSLATISIDASGSRAVTTYLGESTVILWDTATGNRLHEFNDIPFEVSASIITPDGLLVGAIGCMLHDELDGCTETRFLEWDVATGKVRHSLKASSALTVSPDGKLWAMMGEGFEILLVDVQTGTIVHSLYGNSHYVKAVAFSEAGTRLVSSSYLNNEAIYVWDVASGQELRQITTNANVWELFFSSSGRYFFSLDFPISFGAVNFSLSRWRLDDTLGSLLDWTEQNRDWPAFTCGERVRYNILPLCNDTTNSQGNTEQEVAALTTRTPFPTVPVQPSRTPYPRTATPTATATATPTVTPTEAPYVYRALYDVQWSPDGTRLLAGEESGFIAVWDVATRTELYRFGGHDTRTAFDGARARWSPDGTRIVSYTAQNNALIWDANTGMLLHTLTGHKDDIVTMNWSPDGSYVVSASLDGTARVWNTEMGSLVTVFTGHNAPLETVAFSPDGKLIASGADDGTARVWDAMAGIEVWNFGERDENIYTEVLQEPVQIYALSWSRDSRLLIAAGSDGVAIDWDVKTGKQIKRLEYPQSTTDLSNGVNSIQNNLRPNWIFNVYWSPDERFILLHTLFTAPTVWDAQTNQQLFALTGHSDIVARALWSPNGNQIMTAGTDGTIRIWDAATGTQILVMDHRATVTAASWSPDSTRIVSSAQNGTLRLWDSQTGVELPLLAPPALGVTPQVTDVVGAASTQLQMTIGPMLDSVMTLEALMTQSAGG